MAQLDHREKELEYDHDHSQYSGLFRVESSEPLGRPNICEASFQFDLSSRSSYGTYVTENNAWGIKGTEWIVLEYGRMYPLTKAGLHQERECQGEAQPLIGLEKRCAAFSWQHRPARALLVLTLTISLGEPYVRVLVVTVEPVGLEIKRSWGDS